MRGNRDLQGKWDRVSIVCQVGADQKDPKATATCYISKKKARRGFIGPFLWSRSIGERTKIRAFVDESQEGAQPTVLYRIERRAGDDSSIGPLSQSGSSLEYRRVRAPAETADELTEKYFEERSNI